MEPIIIYNDQLSLEEALGRNQENVNKLQALYDACIALDLIRINTISELFILAVCGSRYVSEKMQQDKVFRTNMPDLSILDELSKQCHQFVNDGNIYELKDGTVSLSQSFIDNATNEHLIVAKTTKQQAVIIAHKEAAEALSKLNACLKEVIGFEVLDRTLQMGECFTFDRDGITASNSIYQTYRIPFQASL